MCGLFRGDCVVLGCALPTGVEPCLHDEKFDHDPEVTVE